MIEKRTSSIYTFWKPIEISVRIHLNREPFIKYFCWIEKSFILINDSMPINVLPAKLWLLLFSRFGNRVKNYQQLYVGKIFDYYNFSFPITWNIIKCVWYWVFFSFTRCHRKLVTCLHPALSISSETVSQGPSLARLFQGYCDHYARSPL